MQIYTLLGIQPNATEAEIKKAYRKLAVRYHPDKNNGNETSQQKFIAINKAYQLALKNVSLVKRSEFNNTAYTNQTKRKTHSHYSYRHTYYNDNKHKKKEVKEEFNWDKVHSRYSNVNAKKKEPAQKQRAKTTQAKKTIIIEEKVTDYTNVILYMISALVGLLVFTLTQNIMWGISTVFICVSGVLLTQLFHKEENVA